MSALDLNSLIIFGAKKPNRNNKNKSGIYFSLTKNKKEYVGIRFYFDKSTADKYKISENAKIKLACSKHNNRQWFLIIDGDGYTIRADKKGTSFSCLMNFPFKFVENKRMQYIGEENIKYYEENNVLEFSVENYFSENDLILATN